MPTKNTLQFQEDIATLGEALGLEAELESSFATGPYRPRYDVVWYLRTDFVMDSEALSPWLGESLLGRLRRMPLAAFEIEATSASSKTRLGDVVNLASSGAAFPFLLTCNAHANGEDDTWRRSQTMLRTLDAFGRGTPVLFLDQQEFLLEAPKGGDTTVRATPADPKMEWKGTGGDRNSVRAFEGLKPALAASGLTVRPQWKPPLIGAEYKRQRTLHPADACTDEARSSLGWRRRREPGDEKVIAARKAGDAYYVPKIDLVLGVELPPAFVRWLDKQAKALGEWLPSRPALHRLALCGKDLSFFPLLGIEIDSARSKHAIGSIYNLSTFCAAGLMVGPAEGRNTFEELRQTLNIRNLEYLEKERLEKGA